MTQISLITTTVDQFRKAADVIEANGKAYNANDIRADAGDPEATSRATNMVVDGIPFIEETGSFLPRGTTSEDIAKFTPKISIGKYNGQPARMLGLFMEGMTDNRHVMYENGKGQTVCIGHGDFAEVETTINEALER